MAPRVSVTEADLLAALTQAGPKSAPAHAMTAAELRVRLGLNRTTLKRRLNELKAEGRLEVWQTLRPDVTGRMAGVPAYTITPKPAAKQKR